jgi:hypothetical protein
MGGGGEEGWWPSAAVANLMYIKLPMYLFFHKVLVLNDFDWSKNITDKKGEKSTVKDIYFLNILIIWTFEAFKILEEVMHFRKFWNYQWFAYPLPR